MTEKFLFGFELVKLRKTYPVIFEFLEKNWIENNLNKSKIEVMFMTVWEVSGKQFIYSNLFILQMKEIF